MHGIQFRRFVGALAVIGLCGLTPFASLAQADETAFGPLDGRVFVGRIGPRGSPDLDDELHFQDGRFWSLNCIKCGFQPGPYWVRRVGERMLFLGELKGDRGTLRYEGEIVGDRAEVAITWTRSRWYWNINRDLEFAGTHAPTKVAYSLDRATRTADQARPELEAACSR